ncbi:hypothetical protein MASRES_GEN12920_18640 [Acinetobacter baumannii]
MNSGLRPKRSEKYPPIGAPKKIPMSEAAPIKPCHVVDKCKSAVIEGINAPK